MRSSVRGLESRGDIRSLYVYIPFFFLQQHPRRGYIACKAVQPSAIEYDLTVADSSHMMTPSYHGLVALTSQAEKVTKWW